MKRVVTLAAIVALGMACNDSMGGGNPDYELVLAPATLNVQQGAAPTVNVTIARTNFTGGVALFLTGTPAQVSGTFFPATTNSSASTLTLTVGGGVTPGNYTLVVNGNGAPGARTTQLPLTVTPAPNYTLEVSPATLTIARGASDSTTVNIQRSSFTGAVTMGVNNLPSGVTSVYNPVATTGTQSKLVLTVGASVPSGMYDLTVTGNNATLGDRFAGLTLIVPP